MEQATSSTADHRQTDNRRISPGEEFGALRSRYRVFSRMLERRLQCLVSSWKLAILFIVMVGYPFVVSGCEEATSIKDGARKQGDLRVDSSPQGAHIFLDGRDTDRVTPSSFELSPGFHTVRMTREGMQPWGPQTVEIRSGQRHTISVPLVPEAGEPDPPDPALNPQALGLELLPEDAYESAYVLRADPVALPSRVDLSVSDFPAPGNQGHQGSCVGWAVAYAVKSYHEKVERRWSLTNRAHIMSPAYVYNQIKLGGSGAYFVDAFNLLVNQGVSSWDLMPYDPDDDRSQPSAAARVEAAHYKIADWSVVYRRTHAEFVLEMKRHLAGGAPIPIGISVYPDFGNISESNPIYDDASGPKRGNHAIVVVGYDDSKNAFRVINSWGTRWGLGGYGWIDYDASASLINEAYVLSDITTEDTGLLPSRAAQPAPSDAATRVPVDTTLTWTKGNRTTSFDVYLGTEPELVALDFQGSTAATEFQGALAPGTVYYWRVDSRNAAGLTRGPVWSFTTAGDRDQRPLPPVDPHPNNGARDVGLDANLRWTSGGFTTSYDVYFGTDSTPDSGEFQTPRGRTSFDPGPLSSGTEYFWRVDAKNATGTTEGPVWSFTTGGSADTQPTFGGSVQVGVLTVDVPMPPKTLQAATGGNAPLRYSLTPIPQGLNFDGIRRRLSGTPRTSGTYRVTYTVQDADGDIDSLRFTITVEDEPPPNTAPSFGGQRVNDQTYTLNQSIPTLILPAAIGGEGALRYSLTPIPQGLRFDSGRRRLTGAPIVTGVYRVTYTVEDTDRDRDSLFFTITVIADSRPDLIVENARVDSDDLEVNLGDPAYLNYTVRNRGTGASPTTTVRFYRSYDSTISTSDTDLIPGIPGPTIPPISAGSSLNSSSGFANHTEVGTFYLGVCVVPVPGETNTTNNCSNGVAITVVDPTLSVPDLIPRVWVNSDDSEVETGATFRLRFTVDNRGTGDASATTIRYYRSNDSIISSSDTQEGSVSSPPISAGEGRGWSEGRPVTAPSVAETYYYGVCVDAVAGETNTANNCSDGVGVTVVDTTPADDQWTATASSFGSYAGYVASPDQAIINDNDYDTFWCATAVPGWFKIEFPSSLFIPFLRVEFKHHTVSGNLEVSSDGSGWTRVTDFSTDASDTGPGNDDPETKVFALRRSARFVRINFTDTDAPRSHIYQACISEVAVIDQSPLIPDLVVDPPPQSYAPVAPGETFNFAPTVRNQGTGQAAATTLRYYRSSDATIDTADTPAGTDPVRSLAAGARSGEDIELTAPSTPGTYYYGACVDAVQGESNTDNNCTTGVRITVEGGPDLVVDPPPQSYAPVAPGETFNFAPTVRNQGTGQAAATTLRYYRSSDATIDTADTPAGTDPVRSLAAGARSGEDIELTAPSTPGTYYYGACVDAVQGESDTDNNCSTGVRITVEGSPDLVVDPPPQSYAPVAPGETFNFAPTVRNQGTGQAAATTLRYYRSRDATIDTADTPAGTDPVRSLAAGARSGEDIELTAPSTPGTYHYGACVDAVQGESDTDNNCSTGVRITVEGPDLIVESASVLSDAVNAGGSFALEVTVRNQGGARSAATTTRYYRSTDATIRRSDTQLKSESTRDLDSDETDQEQATLTAWPEGSYYFGACVDTVAGESDTTNNCSEGVPVTIDVGDRYQDAFEVEIESQCPVSSGKCGLYTNLDLTAGDDDWFKWDPGNSGTCGNLRAWSTGSTDTKAELSDGDGGVSLDTDDDGGDGSNFLVESGEIERHGYYYFLLVEPYSSGGTYDLYLEFNESTCSSEDDGDTRDTATALTGQSGSRQRWSLSKTLTAGDRDMFKFQYDSGRGRLEAYTSGSLDTFGTLYYGNGDLIDTNDNRGSGDNFKLTEYGVIGTYYIEVKGKNESQTGSYTLVVEWDERDASDTFPYAIGSLYSNSDRDHPDYLASGDVDYFKTTVGSCGYLSATTFLSNPLVGTFGSIDTQGTLYSDTGGQLDEDDDSGDGLHFAMRTKVRAGTYYVKVEPYDSTEIGPYTLNLDFDSSDCSGTVN